jgi:hypothetical protein
LLKLGFELQGMGVGGLSSFFSLTPKNQQPFILLPSLVIVHLNQTNLEQFILVGVKNKTRQIYNTHFFQHPITAILESIKLN